MLKHLIFLLVFATSLHAQNVVLNEFVAANTSGITDPDFKEKVDWIELYNPSATSANIGGFYLTDDLKNPKKWQIPSGTSIAAKGFLLIWADERNTKLHTNFKLSASGEEIGLFHADGSQLDSIVFPEQVADVSYGRAPDASATWRYFAPPSPNAINNVANVFSALAEMPKASIAGGLYTTSQNVALSTTMTNATIRYTLDGKPPSSNSMVYASPIGITKTTALRATVFKDGYKESPILTQSYIINENPTVAVVSLVTDPANFFDNQIGIYVEGTNGISGNCSSKAVNWNQDWERPVHVSMFEPSGKVAFAQDMAVQIFGGCSRIYPQKSLGLYAKSAYGPSKIRYQVFSDLPVEEFDNLVLRSGGQDWYRTMFRDEMIHTIIKQGMDVEVMAYRPSLVFLNGEFLGIHNIREKQNEHYLAGRFKIDGDKTDILEINRTVKNGSRAHYDAMISYIASADMTKASSLEEVNKQMDVQNFMNYSIAQIISANGDWPGHNIQYWRPQTAEGRWRWMIYDTDFGFGGNSNGMVNSNTLTWATDPASTTEYNPPWSTLLLRKLLENQRFREDFIQQSAAHLNTTFQTKRVHFVIDSLKTGIAAEIPRHVARWKASLSFGKTWDESIQIMRDFATNRPNALRNFYHAKFGLAGSAKLQFSTNDPKGGYITTQGVKIPNDGRDLTYFKNLPLRLKAFPAKGYRFSGWEVAGLIVRDDTLTVRMAGDMTLKALFTSLSVANEENLQAQNITLSHYPNPVQNAATILLHLPKSETISLKLVDMLGRTVLRISEEMLWQRGTHQIPLDTSHLANGVYFLQLQTPNMQRSDKVIVMR